MAQEKKLTLTLSSDTDIKALEALITSKGLEILVRSTNPKINGQPLAVTAAKVVVHEGFKSVRQGTATNEFTKVRATPQNTVHIALKQVSEIRRGDMIITIPDDYSPKGLKTSTYQLLDAAMWKLTESGAASPEVHLSKEEYLQLRGLESWDKAQRQIKADLSMLLSVQLTRNPSTKRNKTKPGQTFKLMNFFDSAEVDKKGTIRITFAPTFFSLINEKGAFNVAYFPNLLWHLDNKRNPNSYFLGRKIAELKNIQYGDKNEDRISTKTLRENAPYIPSYDEVMAEDRHLTNRIIAPLERDLDALEEILTWEYCHKNGAPLTDEEVQNFNYKLFDTLLVKVTWKDYPPRPPKRKKRQNRTPNHKTDRARKGSQTEKN